MILAWLAALAAAGELRPVRDGDTVESIAASLGDAELAPVIRRLNGIEPGGQPEIGRLLELPPPPSANQVEQRATLVSMVGAVTVAPPGLGAAHGTLFQPIEVGSTVCTPASGFATLLLASSCAGEGHVQDEITLLQASCVVLHSIVASDLGRSSVVEVTTGSVVVSEPPAAGTGDSSVALRVRSALAMGRGGFRTHVELDHTLRTEVLNDRVALMGGGRELTLEAGQGARVTQAGEISDPVELLHAGALLSPGAGEPLRRPVFSWDSVPDAFGYRFSIAGDARSTRVLYQEPTPDPVHRPDLLLLPLTEVSGLWWQVTVLDRFGFLGMPSEARPILLPLGGS